ncbi:hypothetical protein EYF80_067122 [Liparis tanakae]|uniref:Uncharacterized protein n=1 Tax=Liparis tanakae TaxID=230148 RepID=A0A4Z2E307_9TELE|nr:hypothetical protein EYF80_067122 [Liparis tanakae]
MQQAVSQVVRSHNDPVPAVRITGLSEGSRLGFLTQELSDGSLVIVSGLSIHDVLAAEEVGQRVVEVGLVKSSSSLDLNDPVAMEDLLKKVHLPLINNRTTGDT